MGRRCRRTSGSCRSPTSASAAPSSHRPVPGPPPRSRTTRPVGGARPALRGGRRGAHHPHEAAGDDADAPGRDRVPRRQGRSPRSTPTSATPRSARPRRRSALDRASRSSRRRARPPCTRCPGRSLIAPFVGLIEVPPGARAAPARGRRACSTSPSSELLDDGGASARSAGTSRARGRADRAIHFFELAGETVWGATARILAGFPRAPHRRGADRRRLAGAATME